jgi:hypothetical protein
MPDRKPEKDRFGMWFCCDECKDHEVTTAHEMLEHLRLVHKIYAESGTKELVMHVDEARSWFSVYRWTVGGKKFTQSVRGPRGKGANLGG